MADQNKALVLGLFETDEEGIVEYSEALQGYVENKALKLPELIKLSRLASGNGLCRLFYGLEEEHAAVAVVNLGHKDATYSELEEQEEQRENIRTGVAVGVKQLRDAGFILIQVDPCGDAEAAAEGANLCLYSYVEFKQAFNTCPKATIECFLSYSSEKDKLEQAWKKGCVLSAGQLKAQALMDAPSNVLTPTRFAQIAQNILGTLENCHVITRDEAWLVEQDMRAFLAVSRGSVEPPRLVEVTYSGSGPDNPPLVLVGKGVTFDSGGISLKQADGMQGARADMGGAACTLGAIYAAATLRIPINIKGVISLCENMPSGKAYKPGDVITTRSGKTIQVNNTDCEGRMILADTLNYVHTFSPYAIIDLATLTGAMMVAVGSAATGVFSTCPLLWDLLHKAGSRTGDRVWRMPLFKYYSKQMTTSELADVSNTGTDGRLGGACTAAAFLREFVTHDKWMHLDLSGYSNYGSEIPYLGKGMSGRPTRTLVQFISDLSVQI